VTTSGTNLFNLDLNDIIEEAFERCGVEVRTGYEHRTARRSLNLLTIEWANRGINLWTIEQGSIPMVQGQIVYNLPNDTIDLLDQVIRTQTGVEQTDINISRISVSTYATIPNKLQQARPIQIWIERLNTPQFTVWPVPDDSQTYTLVYWRLRRIQNAGEGVNTMDMPFRFIPCMIAGLAYYLAMKLPGGMDRIQVLKAQYDEAWQLASDEDREKAAVRFVPRRQYLGSGA